MDKVSRSLGYCITETKRKDFDQKVQQLAEFVTVSQFSPQPKHVSEIKGELVDHYTIYTGTILYGVEQDGTLTWLGEIIDSGD